MTYRLWLANADTDPEKANPYIAVDNIDATTETVTLETKGRFFVGCQAVLDDRESIINWADEPENMGDNPLFGLRFAVPPHPPKNTKKR